MREMRVLSIPKCRRLFSKMARGRGTVIGLIDGPKIDNDDLLVCDDDIFAFCCVNTV